MDIRLTNKFKRDGIYSNISVNFIRNIYDGFVQTKDGKYIAVMETKKEIENLIKEAENG